MLVPVPVRRRGELFKSSVLHSPLASSADLDGREVTTAHERVGLRAGHVQLPSDLFQRQESTLGDALDVLRRGGQ